MDITTAIFHRNPKVTEMTEEPVWNRKTVFLKSILTMIIFAISQRNERGLGIRCIILKEWAVIFLTFGL